MIKKNGKYSVDELNKVVETAIVDTFPVRYETSGKTLDLEVKSFLDFANRVSFVNIVAGMCFSKGQYVPALFDYAFKSNVISYFTNLTLSTSPEGVNRIVYGTSIYRHIIKNAPVAFAEYLDELKRSCKEDIAYRLKAPSVSDQVIERFVSLIDDAKEFMSGLNESIGDENVRALLTQGVGRTDSAT